MLKPEKFDVKAIERNGMTGPNSIRGGTAENLGFWPSPRKRK